MSKPIMQICVPSEGVGFIIDYRTTRDRVDEIWEDGICLGWDSFPQRPSGLGWVRVHSSNDKSTLWRRIRPWIGPLSKYARRRR